MHAVQFAALDQPFGAPKPTRVLKKKG